jgi:hypothetical protein
VIRKAQSNRFELAAEAALHLGKRGLIGIFSQLERAQLEIQSATVFERTFAQRIAQARGLLDLLHFLDGRRLLRFEFLDRSGRLVELLPLAPSRS